MARAFIIGNGPSLRLMDLTKLKNEITFGCNTIYNYYDRMGFHTTYYFNIDSIQPFITKRKIFKYISHPDVKYAYFLDRHRDFFKCDKCLYINYRNYRTVGMAMIWKALELKYNPIYLIGMDLTYNYPPRESLIKINGISDLKFDDEIMDTLKKASNKGIVNWEDLYLFPRNIKDKSHITNEYNINHIPFHYETTDQVIKAYSYNFSRMPKDEKSKIFNAGIEGNFNFVRRIDYESLF